MPITKRFQSFAPRPALVALALAVSALATSPRAEPMHGNEALAASQPNGDDAALRLQAIGYRLARANASLCGTPAMLTGLMLHNIGGYGQADRPAVIEAYGLSYGFGVLDIVPGSVADAAGLEQGDEIVSVNGADLASFAKDSIRTNASYDRTEKFVEYLGTALHGGPATLEVRREDKRFSVRLAGAQGCGGWFAMLHRNSLNAWSDGRYVAVTDRMMSTVPDNQELAFVVAHEMAHNILHHADQTNAMSPLLAQFGIGAGKMKRSEIEADTLAVELMARAGYDLEAPERLLRRTSSARWMDLPITHPGITRRIQIVRAAAAQIARARPGEQTPRPSAQAASTARIEARPERPASAATLVASAVPR